MVEAVRNHILPRKDDSAFNTEMMGYLQSHQSQSSELISKLDEQREILDAVSHSQQTAYPNTKLAETLLASLLPSIQSSKIDVEELTSNLDERFQSFLTKLQVSQEPDWASKIEERMVALLLESVQESASATEALSSKSDESVKKLMEALTQPLPVDLGPIHQKLDSLRANPTDNERDQDQLISRMEASLSFYLSQLKTSILEPHPSIGVLAERLRLSEAEKDRLSTDLADVRKTKLDHLAFQAKANLEAVKDKGTIEELTYRFNLLKGEKEASLEREKMFRKENDEKSMVRDLFFL